MDEFTTPDPTRADTVWMTHGLCRELDPQVFFPSTGTGVVQAQRICKRCPVSSECLEYALTYAIEHGVWGGVSERGRRKLVSQRRKEGQGPVRLSPIRRIQRTGVE